jgi:hypothetical protein
LKRRVEEKVLEGNARSEIQKGVKAKFCGCYMFLLDVKGRGVTMKGT